MILRRHFLARGAPPKRTAYLPRSTTPIAKAGPAKARRSKRYQAFLHSAAWKRIRQAQLESSPICELALEHCLVDQRLTVHHLTYARFGGKELPSDVGRRDRPGCATPNHRPGPRMLTDRQRQVALLVQADKSYGAIARALHMSPHTARSHVRSIAATLTNEHGLPALRLVRQWTRTANIAVSPGGDAQQQPVLHNDTMPWAAKRPCRHPGCPRVSATGYCTEHAREREQARGTSSQRDYGAPWRATRQRILQRDPCCTIRTHCRGDPSTDVDHVVPRRAGGSEADSNLRGACHRCHSFKTVSEDGGFGRPNARGGARG